MDSHSKVSLVRGDSVRGQDEILLSESKITWLPIFSLKIDETVS